MAANESPRCAVGKRNSPSDVVLSVELRQLEHFLAVVEEGSFTAAAARLYMGQSSLSGSLLALERELGTELFVRRRRGAELTDAGRAFLEPARAALAHTARARQAVAQTRGLLRGTVRVAAVPMPKGLDILDTIGRFHERHPDVEVQVIPADAKSMADLVADGKLDFAVTPRPEPLHKAVRFQALTATPLGLLCPANHRLAGARDVDPRVLTDESIIDLPRDWQSRQLFDRLLDEQGLHRHVHLEVTDWFGVLALVQRGIGISYGPLACIDQQAFADVDHATLAGGPTWEVGVATRDDALRGPAGRALLALYLERGDQPRAPIPT